MAALACDAILTPSSHGGARKTHASRIPANGRCPQEVKKEEGGKRKEERGRRK
jgi:hypothetical protein